MKKFARTLCIALSIVLCFSCITFFAACQDGDGNKDEGSTLIFSVQELDNVFNPYFTTSGYDSEILGQTQAAMLTTDTKGEVYCGTDEPTVALDYSQIITFKGEEYDPNGSVESKKTPNLDGHPADYYGVDEYYTTYKFLIKNGIKFSDGKDLTIKDVIFNMYTFLDPLYYGSSTMYSTAIKGLLDYRMQMEGASEGASNNLNRKANSEAMSRITTMRSVYMKGDPKQLNTYRSMYPTLDSRKNIIKDIEFVRNTFWDEIQSDYKSAEASLEDFDKQFGFTETWEIFLYNEGLIYVTFNTDGTIKKYEEDNIGTDKNGNRHKKGDLMIDYGKTGSWWHDQDSLTKIVFNNYMGIAKDSEEYGNYFSNKSGKPQTDIQLNDLKKANGSKYSSNAADYDERIWNSDELLLNLYDVLTYWVTATTVRDEFVAQAKQKEFNSTTQSDLAVPTISGIKIIKLTNGDTFKGRFGSHNITEDQYVLEVTIDRVDPKAIWNFAFAVAPMHYYSNAANSNGMFDSTVDYHSFNYPVYDKNGNMLDKEGDIWDKNKKISVGRPFANKDYMDNVLKASNIISVPVGAGPYRAASSSTDMDKEYKLPTFTEFCSDNIVYYIYNPYFYTTSGEGKDKDSSSICNCKIPYIRYKIINQTKLLNSIINGEVHYGDPTASPENVNTVNKTSKVTGISIPNSGYGYIGINAKYVPDLEVRKAIMHAMDLEPVKTYYGAFADIIYRPMSTVSWASPQNATNPLNSQSKYKQPYYQYDSTGNTSETLVKQVQAGTSKYELVNGVYQRKLSDGTTHKLEYTFTIAGATDDHPAYNTLKGAAEILNKHGFKITVKTDSQALSKLASGLLTVWAAAWGSATDPDMYQVYHMDSTATAVRNWGYPEILAAGKNDATYGKQYEMLETLSELIEDARSMLDIPSRRAIYAEALDDVMELAIELPTYQRDNFYVFRNDIVDERSLDPDRSPYGGPLSKLWTVKLVNQKVFSK